MRKSKKQGLSPHEDVAREACMATYTRQAGYQCAFCHYVGRTSPVRAGRPPRWGI